MKKNGSFQQMLDIFYEATYLLPRPFETPYAHARRLLRYDPDRVYRGVHYLKKQGYIEVAFKQGEKFIKLTKKGQLKALLEKASIDKTEEWDGKWRLIIFDIPEKCNAQRAWFRELLRQNYFYKLQASVYISPYSLNQEAVSYLKSTGLMEFIRILRVDKMDNDKKMRKRFKI